jgi:iron(III) transport system substrate-binding protein
MERYPDILVEVFEISTADMIERFYREYTAGIRNVDMLHLADGDGTLWMEFVQRGMLHLYHPYDIVPYIDPAFLTTTMPMFVEFTSWFYNTEYFPDGAPITSWWELTTPEWNARMLTRHPLEHINTLALFATMLLFEDEMAADYEAVFGTPITLSPGSDTAAHEFIRRFMANDPIFLSSSGEIVRSVGGATEDRVIGLGASGGLRRQEDENLPINIITYMTPSVGIPAISSLYIADEANNPNAAKLLVRFMTDYHGEGFAPFGTLGGWPPRTDIPMHEGNIPLYEINFWEQDKAFLYYNVLPIADFILAIQ